MWTKQTAASLNQFGKNFQVYSPKNTCTNVYPNIKISIHVQSFCPTAWHLIIGLKIEDPPNVITGNSYHIRQDELYTLHHMY